MTDSGPLDKPTHPPRTKDQVVRRCFAMRAMLYRTELELQSRAANFAENQNATATIREAVIPTLEINGLWGELTAYEQQQMGSPVGQWQEDDVAALSWQNESLGTLLWALDLVDDMPTWETPMNLQGKLFLLDLDGSDSGSWVSHVDLIDPDEIEGCRHYAEIWHWRAKAQAILRGEMTLSLPPGKTVEDVMLPIIAYTAEQAEQSELFLRIDGDFPVWGKAYANCSAEDLGLLRAIARERHHALNWLTGFGGTWDDVSLDT